MEYVLSHDGQQIVLEIVDGSPADGRLLARVPVTYSDFQMARDETWLHGMRAGELRADLYQYALHIEPGKKSDGGLVDGYTVELANGKTAFRRRFNVRSLSSVAQRALVHLVKEESVKLDDDVKYYLTSVPADKPSNEGPEKMNVKVHREPLMFEEARLSDFLEASEPLTGVSEPPNESDEKPMPMFVLPDAWSDARQHAFRGGEDESAALFSGRLFRDTASSEIFLCMEACLEAVHAVEDKLSVTFTGATWTRLRELLELRRRRLKVPNEIILASVHRHPFMPAADANGQRKCDVCAMAHYCSRSTAVPSTDDFEWHRSVFASQPWGTLLIWGYTAREEEDFRLYGLQNATFKQRSIRLLNKGVC